jgi:hypothetical protein
MVQLWGALQNPMPDLARMALIGRRMRTSVLAADEHYKALLAIHRNRVDILRRYGSFMLQVQGRVTKGEELLARADRLERTSSSKQQSRSIRFRLLHEAGQMDTAGPQVATITTSGEMARLGDILSTTSQTASLFRVPPSSLQGNNIFQLMPQFIGAFMRSTILKYIQSGSQGLILVKPKFIFYVDSQHMLQTTRCCIEDVPPSASDDQVNFNWFIEEVQSDENHALCSLDAEIITLVSVNASASHLLNYSPTEMPESAVFLDSFFPGLSLSILKLVPDKEELYQIAKRQAAEQPAARSLGIVQQPLFNAEGIQVSEASISISLMAREKLHNANIITSADAANLLLLSWARNSHEKDHDDTRNRVSTHASSREFSAQPVSEAYDDISSLGESDRAKTPELLDSDANVSAREELQVVCVKTVLGQEVLAVASSGSAACVSRQASSNATNKATASSLEIECSKQVADEAEDAAAVLLPERRVVTLEKMRNTLSFYVKRDKQIEESGGQVTQQVARARVASVKQLSSRNIISACRVAPADELQINIAGYSEALERLPSEPQVKQHGFAYAGSVQSGASGASSDSTAGSSRAALVRALSVQDTHDLSITRIHWSLRVSLLIATILSVLMTFGMSMAADLTLTRVLSLTHAGEAMRMLQAATVSAAQLNLINLGVPIAQEAPLRVSFSREVSRLRKSWRMVIEDAEALDTLTERAADGGLLQAVQVTDGSGATSSLSLNAAVSNIISNLNALQFMPLESFLLSTQEYSTVLDQAPSLLATKVNATMALRQSQASTFMDLVNSGIVVGAAFATFVLGGILGGYLWVRVAKMAAERQAPIALLFALSKPAVLSLFKHSKAELHAFKSENLEEHADDDSMGEEDDDANDAETGRKDGKKADSAASESSSVSSSDAKLSRMLLRYSNSSRLNTTVVNNRTVLDTEKFSAKHLALFMMQVLLMCAWLGICSISLITSQASLVEEMSRLYGTQQVASQTMKVSQTAALSITLPPGGARNTSVAELSSSLQMVAIRVADLLQGVRRNSFTGDEVASLPTTGKPFMLFTTDVCEAIVGFIDVPSNCSTGVGGFMSLGLQISLQRYLQRGREIYGFMQNRQPQYRVAEAMRFTMNASLWSSPNTTIERTEQLARTDKLLLERQFRLLNSMLAMENPFLRRAMEAMQAMFIAEVGSITNAAWELTLILNCMFLGLSFLLHFALHKHRLRVAQDKLDGARAVLLAVPSGFVQRNKRFAASYKKYVAKLAAYRLAV